MNPKRNKTTMLNFFYKIPKINENSEFRLADPDKEVAQVNVEVAESSSTLTYGSDMDIGLFAGVHLDDCQKLNVFENAWKPNQSFPFPANSKNRKFQYRWLEAYPWLCYSAKCDGAYCKTCVLFSNGDGGQGNQRLGRLVLSPFNKWKDALESFTSHQTCKYHKECTITAENFKKIMKGDALNVSIQLHNKRNAELVKNREKLNSIIKTVLLCGRQGLPLRGHRDSGNISLEETCKNEGNFRALLRFRVESGDGNLKESETSRLISKKYTSPEIQNEIIEVCRQNIQRQIAEDVNKSKCFAILADETTDISGKEFLTLCVRYVEENNSKCIIKEHFMNFIEVEHLTGAAIADVILSNIKKLGIDASYLRGQGYDGASSMSGKLNGVQAKIREELPTALYVHCCNHALNLVLSKSCSVPSIRNTLSTIQEIVTFFRASSKRRNILKHKLEEEFVRGKYTTKKSCLTKFCESRWVERHEALFTFCECLDTIILSLIEIHEDRNCDTETSRKAMHFYNAICQSSFLVSLFVAERCFAITYNLSIGLQKPDVDLISSLNNVQHITEVFKKMRENSEIKFSAIFKKASEAAEELNFEINKPRLVKKQMHRSNIPSESVEDYYRKTVFIPFVEFLIQNMIDRFVAHKSIVSNLHDILPKNVETSSIENIMRCAEFYSDDIRVLPNILQGEVEMWIEKWMSSEKVERPYTAIEALESCDAVIYPNIKKLLKILSTLPVSTATPERTFSTLRRLKTYLRNTMSNARISGLALLNIHREIELKSETIVNIMARKRSYLVL